MTLGIYRIRISGSIPRAYYRSSDTVGRMSFLDTAIDAGEHVKRGFHKDRPQVPARATASDAVTLLYVPCVPLFRSRRRTAFQHSSVPASRIVERAGPGLSSSVPTSLEPRGRHIRVPASSVMHSATPARVNFDTTRRLLDDGHDPSDGR
ncbi:hypothetical protein PYCCODRAFT_892696 [Trametes coccinea BRFM310]|uniref:Uncharacterized protein n=1 Tax=Trametes coccinea (strain BRFM310) TaxID=1353009 RepID=A0A1Y2ICP6_TRAC3|nr:hypothetical protein PYCCODRAFT_892696 [Trametes coccinea BRFM310]